MADGSLTIKHAVSGRDFSGLRVFLYAAPVAALIVQMHGKILMEMMVECWNSPALSQGVVIPPFALYVAWLRRGQLMSIEPRVDFRGIAAVAAGCVLFLLGKLGAEFFLSRVSFVIILAGITWTYWGAERTRVLALPFLLLATMVPLPLLVFATLSAPLQLFASDIASRAAELAGVTLFRDGNVLQLANISLGIEEACSGLTSLSSLMVAGVLFGFLVCRSTWMRTAIMLASVPVAILANIVRVAGTAILSDTEPELAMGFYHAFSGWLVFVGGAIALYTIAQGMRKLEK
jgi:exosortase